MSETYGLPQSLIPSMTQTLRAMKRLELGVYNCVASAVHDAQFVEQVAACRARWPLLANVRCGAWYVERPSGVCAFKSTDGHSGNWSFSTVRLNLHTAAEARRAGGCVIADATRRGKVFPDAMSKTIPIWAAVLNRAARALGLVEGGEEEDGDGTRPEHDLRLPPWIPASEREQILPKIDAWVTDLRGVCCEETLRQCLPRKPLRCYWIAQQASEAAS
ncbi:initiator tRNA phosphoribosyl transferase, partial [Helicosporidium sp. ATCC 50920]